MGITQKSLDRLNPYLKRDLKMLELGAQNLYDSENYGRTAKHYFCENGLYHLSLDIIQHQECEYADLRDPLDLNETFNIVTNYGTLEHIDGSLYQPFKNIHEACCIGGIMIHENPKTGNWPLHGQHYFTKDFYVQFAKVCNYELLEVCEEAAMGNTIDGWNVCAVLRKKEDAAFISETKFNKIYKAYIHAK